MVLNLQMLNMKIFSKTHIQLHIINGNLVKN